MRPIFDKETNYGLPIDQSISYTSKYDIRILYIVLL